jgi:hypothetical protein
MNHLGDTNKMVGEDHIRDATKMVSDTPRTDAKRGFHDLDTAVDAEFSEQLECELNASNDRIKRLEEAGDNMVTEEDVFIRLKIWTKAKEAKP